MSINGEATKADEEDWERMSKPERQLHRVRIRLDFQDRAVIRFTLKGDPILLVDDHYTVVYYERNKRFSVYTSYKDRDVDQKRYDFKTFAEVSDFFNDAELGNM